MTDDSTLDDDDDDVAREVDGILDALDALDDATRAIDDAVVRDGDETTDAIDADDVVLYRRAVRFAFLARYLGVRGWEDVEEPNPYLAARFEHRASTIARESSPDVLLRVVSETTRDRVAYVPDGPLPRLLGSLSEPDATACAILMLWAEDKAAAAERVSAVEGYACERAKRDAARWANDAKTRRGGRFVTAYAVDADRGE